MPEAFKGPDPNTLSDAVALFNHGEFTPPDEDRPYLFLHRNHDENLEQYRENFDYIRKPGLGRTRRHIK